MIRIVFSDIDGTLAHYENQFSDFGGIVWENRENGEAIYEDKASGSRRRCRILKSLSSGNAYVSFYTIDLVSRLREAGILFVLISGARKSTFLNRIPMLPEADFWVAENGGRIYEKGILDENWSHKFLAVTGDIETKLEAENRPGILWDLYRKLIKEGWVIDTKDYYANFRIDLKKCPGKSEGDLLQIGEELPKEVKSTFNLNKADFYPAASGKGNSLKYILRKTAISKNQSAAIMDDDNDLPMTEEVEYVFIPGISNENVAEAAVAHQNWYISKAKGILGIEEVLKRILEISRVTIPVNQAEE